MDDFANYDDSPAPVQGGGSSRKPVRGGAFGRPAVGGLKKPKAATGPPVIFSGNVSYKSVSMCVLPYEKATSARIVVSVPWKANAHTMYYVQGSAGGPNYGDADVAAGGYALFRNIADALGDQNMAAKYGLVNAHMYGTGTTLNMIFDFANRETKVFNSLKTIFRKMEPKRAVWSNAIKSLSGPDGKALKSTAEGWDAACAAADKARKSVVVFATGRLLVKSRDGVSGVKAKVVEKLAKAHMGLEAHKSSGAAAAPDHPKYEAVKPAGRCFEIRDSNDYFAYDYYREVARPWGHGFCLVRDVTASDASKQKYAETAITKGGKLLPIMAAWGASATGLFTASDLQGFDRDVKKTDILRAI